MATVDFEVGFFFCSVQLLMLAEVMWERPAVARLSNGLTECRKQHHVAMGTARIILSQSSQLCRSCLLTRALCCPFPLQRPPRGDHRHPHHPRQELRSLNQDTGNPPTLAHPHGRPGRHARGNECCMCVAAPCSDSHTLSSYFYRCFPNDASRTFFFL